MGYIHGSQFLTCLIMDWLKQQKKLFRNMFKVYLEIYLLPEL